MLLKPPFRLIVSLNLTDEEAQSIYEKADNFDFEIDDYIKYLIVKDTQNHTSVNDAYLDDEDFVEMNLKLFGESDWESEDAEVI